MKEHPRFNALRIAIVLLPLALLCGACRQVVAEGPSGDAPITVNFDSKIDGVAFVGPPREIGDTEIGHIKSSNAGWVQFMPYGYCLSGKPDVIFNTQHQWWGESSRGIRSMVRSAKRQGLKVMLKPHIWDRGAGWAGGFSMPDEAGWLAWEDNYKDYVMAFARLAEEEDVDIFCVGTELKQITKERPNYFGNLADSVRRVFKGQVTYAANWDNYQNLDFWPKMDFIGVDGYFPLLEDETPAVDKLVKAWEKEKAHLKANSQKYGKPILFAEWGYLSVGKSAWRTWELEANLYDREPNFEAQANCYKAIFEALWDEPWFAGGFVWNWYEYHPKAGGMNDPDHTPQNKPAMEVLKEAYGKIH